MSDPRLDAAGQLGGIFAGIVALLVALGKGAQWLLNWNDARQETRTAKLDRWQQELKEREARLDSEQAAYQQKIEQRLERLETENHALRLAFELVAAPLRALDPENDGLSKAEQLLTAAFPLVPKIPPEMKASLGKLD